MTHQTPGLDRESGSRHWRNVYRDSCQWRGCLSLFFISSSYFLECQKDLSRPGLDGEYCVCSSGRMHSFFISIVQYALYRPRCTYNIVLQPLEGSCKLVRKNDAAHSDALRRSGHTSSRRRLPIERYIIPDGQLFRFLAESLITQNYEYAVGVVTLKFRRSFVNVIEKKHERLEQWKELSPDTEITQQNTFNYGSFVRTCASPGLEAQDA